jgi:hypothetical protein
MHLSLSDVLNYNIGLKWSKIDGHMTVAYHLICLSHEIGYLCNAHDFPKTF